MKNHWQTDELANRVKVRIVRYQALSEAHRVAERFCSIGSRKRLPDDFVQEVQVFRQSIDTVLARLTNLEDTLKRINGAELETIPSWMELILEFDQLRIEGGRLVYACFTITERHKHLDSPGALE